MLINKKIYLSFFVCFAIFCGSKLISSCNKPTNQTTNKPINQQITNLGKYLFFDRRLSINNTRACGTCHNPQFAFTDGYKRSLGAYADLHQRNTQPLFNLVTQKYFTAADSTLHSPLQQMDNPLFSTHPIEMGVKNNEQEIVQRIANDRLYKQLFADAVLKINIDNIKNAIAQFTLSIQSYNSPYDKYLHGDSVALTSDEKSGKQLFFSTKTNCSSCHAGVNFNMPNIVESNTAIFYFNTGLYNIDGKGSYPSYDQGLYEHTKNSNDMGKYRVPTLRNLSYTAPYFHDGSETSLAKIIDYYAAGGRQIVEGINKGNGSSNPYKHRLLKGFAISETQKKQLLLFLLTLNDASFLQNKQYQNPFTYDETKKH